MKSSLKGFPSYCEQAEYNKIYEYQKQRMIPANINPDIVNKLDTVPAPNCFIPSKMECDYCHITLQKEQHVTGAAKLITLTYMKNNTYTFHKRCPTCNVTYMYTDYKQWGIYNFDNHILLSLKLLLFVRNSLIVFAALLITLGDVTLSTQRLSTAYYHFESMTNHKYSYKCGVLLLMHSLRTASILKVCNYSITCSLLITSSQSFLYKIVTV